MLVIDVNKILSLSYPEDNLPTTAAIYCTLRLEKFGMCNDKIACNNAFKYCRLTIPRFYVDFNIFTIYWLDKDKINSKRICIYLT